MKVMQLTNEAIDVANWRRHEEFAEYPEGARDKTLLYCPEPVPYHFLRGGHRYLFKQSSPRYIEQYWVEIFAYLLGQHMGIPVPPTFVAYDSQRNQSGALIEWFLNQVNSSEEEYIPGGDYCQQFIPQFDRKKGWQHNFETVIHIFNDLMKKHPKFHMDWKNYWAKVFLFDALIGNTDRHQDNWGIIVSPNNIDIRISPVFDNGTSMGHEIQFNKLKRFNDTKQLVNYINKGSHHMKWALNDIELSGHFEMLQKMLLKYPQTRSVMLECLKKVNNDIFKDILNNLVIFVVPIKLSKERVDFMLKLLQCRYQRLLNTLEN